MSIVLWFHRFRAVKGSLFYRIRCVSGFHGFICFVVSMVSLFHVFRVLIGFVVSMVSWLHRLRGVKGFMVL